MKTQDYENYEKQVQEFLSNEVIKQRIENLTKKISAKQAEINAITDEVEGFITGINYYMSLLKNNNKK
jgi:hypothetical protein